MTIAKADSANTTYLEWYGEERNRLNKLLPKGFSHRDAGKNSLKTLAPFFLDISPFWEIPADHKNNDPHPEHKIKNSFIH